MSAVPAVAEQPRLGVVIASGSNPLTQTWVPATELVLGLLRVLAWVPLGVTALIPGAAEVQERLPRPRVQVR